MPEAEAMAEHEDAPRPRPGVLEIAPYVGGESALAGQARVRKLSSNENPWGQSPRARDAHAAAAGALARYPDGTHAGLRAAIGEVLGLDPDRIVCGAGSDELLVLLAHAYAGPGDEVIHTAHGFAMYRIAALAAGARPVEVAEGDRRIDPGAILAAAGPRTRLVYVANPANPTGTLLSGAEVAALADGLPPRCLLVLDGAYAEFASGPGFDAGAALAAERPNVVMTRTFSKIHGLAGLRVGWAFGPAPVIDALNRMRGPFNLGGPALAAAEAAIRDRDWWQDCARRNAALRDRLAALLDAAGIPSDPSQANFVLARFADPATALAADAHLRGQGILVRRVAGYGFPACLRISIGTDEDVEAVGAALRSFMAAR